MSERKQYTKWNITAVHIMAFVIVVNLIQFPILNSKPNYRYAALHRYKTYDIYESLLPAGGFNRRYGLAYAIRSVTDNADLYLPTDSVYLTPGTRERFRMASMGKIKNFYGYSENIDVQNILSSKNLEEYLVDTNSIYVETDDKKIKESSLPSIIWSLYAKSDSVQQLILIVDDLNQNIFIDTALIEDGLLRELNK